MQGWTLIFGSLLQIAPNLVHACTAIKFTINREGIPLFHDLAIFIPNWENKSIDSIKFFCPVQLCLLNRTSKTWWCFVPMWLKVIRWFYIKHLVVLARLYCLWLHNYSFTIAKWRKWVTWGKLSRNKWKESSLKGTDISCFRRLRLNYQEDLFCLKTEPILSADNW